MGSERASSSSDVFLTACVIIIVALLLAVSLHAFVVDVISLWRERNALFVSASERQKHLVDVISTELQDVEAGAQVLHAAGEFLAVLDGTSRGLEVDRKRSSVSVVSGGVEIEME